MRISHTTLIPAAGALALLLTLPSSARAADTYEVDPVHTFVMFKALHAGAGYTHGMFRKTTGKLVVDAKNPRKSSVSLVVDASSVFTAEKQRDKHLKSPDFLNVKQFPTITFESTSVKKSGKGARVTGKLTLHGVTRTVTVQMDKIGEGKDHKGTYRIGLEGTFSVKRSDFGMTKMMGPVGETIHLTVAVEGIRK